MDSFVIRDDCYINLSKSLQKQVPVKARVLMGLSYIFSLIPKLSVKKNHAHDHKSIHIPYLRPTVYLILKAISRKFYSQVIQFYS